LSKPFIITFAGVPGTSKTPTAFHLSYTFQLPIIQMDAIRMEVREDLLIHDGADPRVLGEYRRRSITRYQALLKAGVCFIDDSSADRSWKQQPTDQYYQLQEHGYDCFIISMDLSMEFIRKLYAANHSLSKDNLEELFNDHRQFLEKYSDDVGVHITDQQFLERMSICERAVKVFLVDRGYQ
jgi:hypothetical protein